MTRLTRALLSIIFGLASVNVSLAQAAPSSSAVPSPAFAPLTPVNSVWTITPDQAQTAPAADPTPDTVAIPVQAQPNAASVTPNFGGFRVAPSVPAHTPGDTSRNLSSIGADVNHDGCEDVVVFQSQTLTVMLGDCHGGFTRAGSQKTALSVYHPVAVDLNHDGYPDIVAMTYPYGYAGTVVAMLNQKNGTFSAPVVISKKASVYSGLMSMNVYDINGDGNPDVIISGVGTTDAMTNSNVVMEVVTGNADGSFNTAGEIESVGTFPYKPTFAFDGATSIRMVNGQLYLYGILVQTVRQYDQEFGSELLCRWPVFANGKVDLANVQTTTLPFFNTAPNKYLNFADLNGDGIADITLLNGDGELYTALGAADGSFGTMQAALPPTFGALAGVISFQDVDGDGRVDAIIAGSAFVGVWPGNGDGTFRAPTMTDLAGYALNATTGLIFPVTNHVIADFDGDGIPDVAFMDTIKRALAFYKGKPNGTFIGAPALVSTTGSFPTNAIAVLATPDLNGDGIKDVIVNTAYGLLGGIADGKGNFTYQRLSSTKLISSVSAYTADFNKDGKEDILFSLSDQNGYPHLYIGFSNGDGSITPVEQPLPYSSTLSPLVLIGDINGDGYPDLALAVNIFSPSPAKYGVYTLINDGKGNLAFGSSLTTPTSLYGAALQDMNGDGKADLLLSYGAYSATTTALYLAKSDGTYPSSPTTILQKTLPAASILAKDVTGDGIPDAVLTITNGASQGLMLYVGNGDGTFNAGTPLVTGVPAYYTNVADLNGDGYPDIFFTNAETQLTDNNDPYFGLVVLSGAGNNTFATARHYNIYSATAPVFPMDLYGNGTLSLLASSPSAGTTVLLNTGGTQLSVAPTKSAWSSVENVSLTVQVAPFYSDQPVPSGYVDVYVDGAMAARAAIGSNNSAYVSIGALAPGTHVLSAHYEGDTNYNVNLHSSQSSITVMRATPAFSISSSSSTLTLSQTGGASFTLSLQANAAFSGPVTLSCSGVPSGTSCSFSQSSVTLAPGQAITSTVTLQANPQSASVVPGGAHAGILACTLLLLVPFAHKRRRLQILGLAFCMGAALSMVSGCSTSSKASTAVAKVSNYSITVAATPGDPTAATQTVTMLVTTAQ